MSQLDEYRKGQYTVYFKDDESYLGRFEVGPFEAESIREAISEARETANSALHDDERLFSNEDVATVWVDGERVHDHRAAV